MDLEAVEGLLLGELETVGELEMGGDSSGCTSSRSRVDVDGHSGCG